MARVFLSYASEDRAVADDLAVALRDRGHTLFFDRDDLPAGGDFKSQIERALSRSDIFVFLVSPSAVKPGRFTLTEAKLARARWPRPGRRVLPVMVAQTPIDDVPSYLRARTILESEGSLIAETASEIDAIARELRRTGRRPLIAGTALAAAAAAVAGFAFLNTPAPIDAGPPTDPIEAGTAAACAPGPASDALAAAPLALEAADGFARDCLRAFFGANYDAQLALMTEPLADAIALAATSWDAELRGGAAALAEGDRDAALDALFAAGDPGGDADAALLFKGAVLLASFIDQSRAIAGLQTLLARDPNDVEALWSLGSLNLTSGRFAAAEAAFARLASTVPADALALQGRIAHLRSDVAIRRADVEAARRHLDAADAAFAVSGDYIGAAGVALTRVELALQFNDLGAASTLLDQAEAAVGGRPAPQFEAGRAFFLGRIALARGDLSEADAAFADAEEAHRVLGQPNVALMAQFNRGLVAMNEGRLADAREIFSAVADEQRALGLTGPAAWTEVQLAGVESVTGDVEGAATRLLDAAATLQELGDRFGASNALLAQAQLLAQRARFDEAAEAFDAAAAAIDGVDDPRFVSFIDYSRGLMERQRGRLDDAQAAFERAHAASSSGGDAFGRMNAAGALGDLAAIQGDRATAIDWFQEALETAEALGAAEAAVFFRDALRRLGG